VQPIKKAMEKALNKDPNFASAHYVLGQLYMKAPGWPLSVGNLDKAKTEAALAVKLGPDYTVNHLGLAEVYVAQKDYTDAREELNKVIAMSLRDDYIPEGKENKEEAKALLNSIAGR
jgi:Tfp pilus assembly protein PilF